MASGLCVLCRMLQHTGLFPCLPLGWQWHYRCPLTLLSATFYDKLTRTQTHTYTQKIAAFVLFYSDKELNYLIPDRYLLCQTAFKFTETFGETVSVHRVITFPWVRAFGTNLFWFSIYFQLPWIFYNFFSSVWILLGGQSLLIRVAVQ